MGEVTAAGAAGGSIWLRPQRAGRGPAPEYSRSRIAAVAVALADAEGLAAVTMRAVAVALETGPASLYRYVQTRDELIELMADEVNGEIGYTGLGAGAGAGAGAGGDREGGGWLDDLLVLARESHGVYLRHPWLLEAVASHQPIGPRAVDYLERALAVLAGLDLDNRVKFEAIGVLGGLVQQLARMEVAQRSAGRSVPQWQQTQAEYLAQVALAGEHPQLAAAMAAQAQAQAQAQADAQAAGTDPDAAAVEPQFDRVIRRVLVGLLQP